MAFPSPLYQKGFGHANKALGKTFTENTLINIGSVTKTVVGLSLLKAQEMGLLSLEDPINDRLPFSVVNPHFPDEPIIIRQLANHTSSIIDSEYFWETCYVRLSPTDSRDPTPTLVPDFFNHPADTSTLLRYHQDMLVQGGAGYSEEGFLASKPGEQYQYSNTGAGLAALIIELAAGMPFHAFAQKHVLQPLGMTSSGWKRSRLDSDRFSKNYANLDTAYADYQLINYPDGGLMASAIDLSQLLLELINGYQGTGTLLTAESYGALFAKGETEELFADVPEDAIPVINLRLDQGIFMALAPQNLVGHTGADPGVISFLFFNTETGIGRVLLVNMNVDDPAQGAATAVFEIWNKLGSHQERFGNYP